MPMTTLRARAQMNRAAIRKAIARTNAVVNAIEGGSPMSLQQGSEFLSFLDEQWRTFIEDEIVAAFLKGARLFDDVARVIVRGRTVVLDRISMQQGGN